MSLTENQKKTVYLVESIRHCGRLAVEDLRRAYHEHGFEDDICISYRDYTDKHLEIAQDIWNLWHTIKNFKVGDKVYFVPLTYTSMENCIRATVTEVNDDGWGYRLRAFQSDLPGIYMFNIWDKDLQPRVGKKQKSTPSELRI